MLPMPDGPQSLSGIYSNITPSSYDPAATSQRVNDGPTYSAEYLSELKANTPSSRPKLQDDNNITYDADVSLAADSLAQSSIAPIVDLTGK